MWGSDDPAPVAKREPTPVSLKLEKIGGGKSVGGRSSAEITACDPLSKRLMVINGANKSVDVLDLSDSTAPTLISSCAALHEGQQRQPSCESIPMLGSRSLAVSGVRFSVSQVELHYRGGAAHLITHNQQRFAVG